MIEPGDVPKTDFLQWIAFAGEISLGDHRTAINFQARIDETGEVAYLFERMKLNDQLRFIYHTHDNHGSRFEQFSLSGLSEGGVRLGTDNLIFTAINSSFGELGGDWFEPTASSSVAKFTAPLSTTSDLPMMAMRLRGFQGFRPLTADCALGTISMVGPSELDNPQLLNGALQIKATDIPSDVAAWKVKADELLDHVRRVMSLGSASILSAPVREYYDAWDVEIIAYSQAAQSTSPMRITHFLNQQAFFEAAVSSFFDPPIRVKNLFYAIEWFAMDAKFNEVRLINAMTVIENLVASNLDEAASQSLPPKECDIRRRVLRGVIRDCIIHR